MKKTKNFPRNITRYIEDDIQHGKTSYEEWLEWREEYFKKSLDGLNKEQLTEEQMDAWEKYLKETDSGHRPC